MMKINFLKYTFNKFFTRDEYQFNIIVSTI